MHVSRIGLLALGLLVFLCGLALGQKTSGPKFSKYDEPASISKMEWNLQKAEVDGMKFRFPVSDGVALPEYSFDHDTETVMARVLVDQQFLGRLSIEQVRDSLRERAGLDEAFVAYYMPEVTEKNFVVYFRAEEKGQFAAFAEYRNGQLTMH